MKKGNHIIDEHNMDMKDEQLTVLLNQLNSGNKKLEDKVYSTIFYQLKKIASRQLRKSPRSTLQTTELVNEAYIKLSHQQKNEWQNKSHFFAIAARLIRFIVVDHTRKRLAQKHGGDMVFVTMDESAIGIAAPDRYPDWIVLDKKLNELNNIDPSCVMVVEMRFLTGMSIRETAEVLGISAKTVNRRWRFARAWLQQQLSDQHSE